MAEIDYVFVYEVYGVLFGLVGFVLVWKRLGGWPEAWYRIFRIPHFHPHVFGPDEEDWRYTKKMTDIDTQKTPPMFLLDGKERIINEARSRRDTGRPAWYYNYDDMEPIDLENWKKGSKWDPSLVTAGYENDAIERVHRLGQKGGIPGWFWVLVAVSIVGIIVIMSVYFNYNTYCAVKPTSCGTGGGVRIA